VKSAQYDFIIAGGGTAGCVLADKLSEDKNHRVLMIEVGPRYRGLSVQMPAALGKMYESGKYHWQYRSQPEPFANGKRLAYKMGRILGGSSAINGLVYLRGHCADYDGWAAMGCDGWSFKDVEQIFRRIENFENKHDPHMGTFGRIGVVDRDSGSSVLNQCFLTAGREAGHPFTDNLNSASRHGFGYLPRNTRCGKRSDVYAAYLQTALGRDNLTVVCNARVEKILLESGRATGLIYSLRSECKTARARHEVILSCGSLGTPQLLQLSGIGDPDLLGGLEIPPLHALPSVGKNLHTHPTISFAWQCKRAVSIFPYTRAPRSWLAGLQWLLFKKGVASSNHFEVAALLKSRPDLDRPDLELTFLPLALNGIAKSTGGHGFQIYVELVGCKSRGETKICSADAGDLPAFHFNFLHDERDIAALRKAVPMVREIVAQPGFATYRGEEIAPGPGVQSAGEINRWIRQNVSLSHHLVGSCRMGPADDPATVVTPDLRLLGIEGLRVVDASIMPEVTSSNTHAAVIMIAEKAADMILGTA